MSLNFLLNPFLKLKVQKFLFSYESILILILILRTISSAEYLEGVYVQSQFVQQIFVYGDSLKSVLVAIVVPKVDNLKLWAKQEGIEVSSLHKHSTRTHTHTEREREEMAFYPLYIN
jgi:hypothetical protein